MKSSQKFSRRHVLGTIAAAAGAFPILTACSSPSSAPTSAPATAAPAPTAAPTQPAPQPTQATQPTVAPTVQPTTAATAQATAAPAQGTTSMQKFSGTIVISPYQISGSPSKLAQDALTKAYQQYQPNVTITWEVPSTANYIQWLGTQLASGNIRPDIVSGNYQASYSHYVDFYKYRYVTNPYTNEQWDKDWQWDYARTDNAAGQRFFLATQAVHIFWFYNQDLFSKAGVEPPKTYDDWVNVCQKLQSAGITPIGMHKNNLIQWLNEVYWDQYDRPWWEIFHAQPGDWDYNAKRDANFKYRPDDQNIDREYDLNDNRYWQAVSKQTIRYDTPEVTDFMKNIMKIFPQYATKDLWLEVDRYALFLQQQVAMMPDASWSLFTLPRDLAHLDETAKKLKLKQGTTLKAFKWSTFENPGMSGSLVKAPVRAIESIAGEYLSAIDKNAQQTAMVADFMMFWMSKPGYQTWIDAYAKSGLWAPSGPILINGVQAPAEYEDQFKQIHMMGNAESDHNAFLVTGGYGSPMQRDTFQAFQDTLAGKMAPEDFGKQFETLIHDKYFNDLIKSAGLSMENIDNPQLAPKKS